MVKELNILYDFFIFHNCAPFMLAYYIKSQQNSTKFETVTCENVKK